LINTNTRKTKLISHLIINKTSNIKQFNHLNSNTKKREKIKDINKRIDLKK